MEQKINDIDRSDVINALVSRTFDIEDITYGNYKDGNNYLIRYRGRIRSTDTAAAYDKLSHDLRSLNFTPLFRLEDDRHVLLIVPGLPEPKHSNPWINLILFGLTFISVWLTGGLYGTQDSLPSSGGELLITLMINGFPFAVSMIAILGAHEFGHYLAGRYHGVHVTLPYFIPLPLSPFGTMGAFINMKEPAKNRRVLLDIGIAGPLSGLLVAVPVLLLGLYLSKVEPLPLITSEGMMLQLEGNSIIYLLSKFIVFGQLLPAPQSYGDLSPVLYWLRYFFTGKPFPLGGTDVILHPVAWAGWAGLLVTAINLIPAGQLDGGHILYVLLDKIKARRLLPVILAILILLGFSWNGWWLWAGLIYLFGRVYAEPLDQITPLDRRRKVLAVSALVIFLLTFTPVPLLIF